MRISDWSSDVCSSDLYRQLVTQDTRGQTHGFRRLDATVGVDIQNQTIKVGALRNARALDRIADATDRAVARIELEHADTAHFFFALGADRRHVAATARDLECHVELAAGEVGEHEVRVDDLDAVVALDVERKSVVEGKSV